MSPIALERGTYLLIRETSRVTNRGGDNDKGNCRRGQFYRIILPFVFFFFFLLPSFLTVVAVHERI